MTPTPQLRWYDWALVPVVALMFLCFALISWVFGRKDIDYDDIGD